MNIYDDLRPEEVNAYKSWIYYDFEQNEALSDNAIKIIHRCCKRDPMRSTNRSPLDVEYITEDYFRPYAETRWYTINHEL